MQVHEHHLLPLGRRKDLLPPNSEGSNRHRQAVPAPNRIRRVQTLSALRLSQQSDMRFIAWCFQGHGNPRLFYYTNNRRRCQPLIRKKDNLSGDPSPQGLSFRLPKSEGSNRHRQAVPAPNRICRVQTLSALRLSQQNDMRFIAWCFQGREESRLLYYTNNRRRCQPLIRKKDNPSGDPSPKPKNFPAR